MKRLLFLFALLPMFSFAWDVPKYYMKPIKPAFSAPFVRVSKTAKPTGDYMVVYQTPTTWCGNDGDPGNTYTGVVEAPGETNSVSVGRYWEVEWNTTTGTYYSVLWMPPNTHYFTIHNRNNWACGTTVTGTWSRPYGW